MGVGEGNRERERFQTYLLVLEMVIRRGKMASVQSPYDNSPSLSSVYYFPYFLDHVCVHEYDMTARKPMITQKRFSPHLAKTSAVYVQGI